VRRTAQGLLGLALGIAVVVVIVWAIGPRATFATLGRLRPWQGLALVAVALANSVFAAGALHLVFRRQGDRVPTWLLFRLCLVAFAVGWILPSGYVAGFPLAAWILRRRGIRFAHALAAFLIERFFEVASFVIVLPFVLLAGLRQSSAALWGVVLGPVAVLAVGVLDVALGWRLARRTLGALRPHVPRAAQAAVDEATHLCVTVVAFFRGPLPLVVGAGALGLLALAASFWRAFLTARFLDLPFTAPEVALLLGFTLVILAVPFAPGALGLYEGSMVGVFALLGRTYAEGAAYAMIVHGVELVVAAIGFLFLAQLGVDLAAMREAGRRAARAD